jgi:hypothetical protein
MEHFFFDKQNGQANEPKWIKFVFRPLESPVAEMNFFPTELVRFEIEMHEAFLHQQTEMSSKETEMEQNSFSSPGEFCSRDVFFLQRNLFGFKETCMEHFSIKKQKCQVNKPKWIQFIFRPLKSPVAEMYFFSTELVRYKREMHGAFFHHQIEMSSK